MMSSSTVKQWVPNVIPRWIIGGALLLWLGITVIIYMAFLSYERIAGPNSEGPVCWPAACSYRPIAGNYSLLMFAHPRCPCTKASVHALAILMSRTKHVDAVVYFLKPSGTAADWSQTDVCKEASRIPGVRVVVDDNAEQTKLFGASTSGECFLYSPSGRLVFSGGMTAGRGHEGDSPGLIVMQEIIGEGFCRISSTPVYGCSLEDSINPNARLFSNEQ